MKKGKRLAVAAVFWMMGGIHAAAGENEESVLTEIRSGGICINMMQYEDMKKTEEWENKEHILPGEKVPMITEVENLGEDCFIRYRITGEAESGQKIPDTCFIGVSEEYIKKDGYWYKTEKLKHGEKMHLFTAFILPDNWIQKERDTIRIRVVADAIQSRNFSPDFTSNSPWGETEIQKVSGEEKNQQLRVVTPGKGSCRIVLEGDRIVSVPDSFFSSLETIVPGDVIVGEIHIDNQYEKEEALYWKLDFKKETLLENSELRIEKGNGNILYQGTFQNFEDGKYNLLDKYQSQEKDKLIFTIQVPEEMDNEYRLLNSQMIWTFQAVPKEQEAAFLKTENIESVKTGENSHIILLGILLFSTLILIIMLIKKRINHE